MERIKFENSHAQEIYTKYLNQVSSVLKGTNKEFKDSVLMEINNHIFEAVSRNGTSELEKIQQVITELGHPNNYLKEIVAEKKLDDALKTYNLMKILKQIYYFSKSSLKYSSYFIIYLLILSISILLFGKILFPQNTGLFYKGDKVAAFGFTPNVEGLTEVLNLWFYPVIILIMGLFYLIFTRILRKQRINRKSRFIINI